MSLSQCSHVAKYSRSTAMSCRICGYQMVYRFSNTILSKYCAYYDQCEQCDFVRVRDPHWFDEAYDAAINCADTGIVIRNLAIANALTALLPRLSRSGPYLDYGGGLGLLVRLMRDRGFDFRWSDRYARNELARGFEYDPDLGPYTAVTAFEVLEHVEDPGEFVMSALAAGQADTLIFSTVLFDGAMPSQDWWYYAPEGGQHISFFSRRTLEALAGRLGLRFLSNGWLHMLTTKDMSQTAFRLILSRPSRYLAELLNRSRDTFTSQDHRKMVEREHMLRKAAAPVQDIVGAPQSAEG
jgi:hypothetical protein